MALLPPTSTISATSAAAEIQKLQTAYGPDAAAAGHSASTFFYSYLPLFEVISVLLTVTFVVASIYVIIQTGWLGLRVDRFRDVVFHSDLSKKRAKASWRSIQRHFFSGDDNALKVAVIEADKLLDEALMGAGVQGKELGERLKKIKPSQLPNIENVWEAHKLRNRIAHESNFVMKRDLAERALTIYEEALKQLGLIGEEEGGSTEAEHRSPPSR